MMEEEPKKKVQIIAPSYYSRLDVQNAIYNFCKNRETVPRYLEGFGKRPDVLDYPSDIFALVKKGATSFHCSEEIWNNPLDINTDMTPEQYNEIKKGWDFLIDIDSKYLDYSKIAADLIVKALEFNGVENIGIKFSGSKGFHLIVPWEAFPEEINGEKTKDNFPEWPRLVAGYIDEIIHDKLVQEIFKMSNKDDLKGKMVYEVICRTTGELAIEKKMSKYICRNCRANMDSTTKSSRKVLKCPSCGYDMDLISSDSFYVCPSTNVSSKIKPEEFEKRATARDLIDSVDIVLVASRHLFRAPYSLHEKTALASVVVDKNDVKNFQPIYADPLKVQIKDFHPNPRKDEAKELLLQALDWAKRKNKIEKKFEGKALDLKGLTISEDMFPEVIKKIMNGMKGDGRKRALSVLVSFLTSLDFPQEYIEEKIDDWNKKNYKPLKEGYIRSQIVWGMKHKRLPPNYDKPVYKELGVLSETSGVKNPINFTIREAMRAKGRKERKGNAK